VEWIGDHRIAAETPLLTETNTSAATALHLSVYSQIKALAVTVPLSTAQIQSAVKETNSLETKKLFAVVRTRPQICLIIGRD